MTSGEHLRPSEQGEPENFFRSLTLDEMYGRPQLTWWVPHHFERQIILRLARSITPDSRKPTVLDAGCGSGIVSKLLAVDNQADVIGVDPDMEGMGYQRLGQSPGRVQFKVSDLWDTLDQFTHPTNSDIDQERRTLLAQVRDDSKQNGPVFSHLHEKIQSGDHTRLVPEITTLQELTRLEAPVSSVDLVVCSFMPPKVDLTVPIRDGIYPKCIVYVRAPEGFVGAGDFYQDGKNTIDEETAETDIVTQDTVISLNPGRNYYTAARWRTTSTNDWNSSQKEFRGPLGGEVIVQLRNDVTMKTPQPLLIEQYPFDDNLLEELDKFRQKPRDRWPVKHFDFLAGINAATDSLFHP